MEKQRFEQLTKGLTKASEPVTIPLNVKPRNGRTAPKSEEHKAKISAALTGRKVSDEAKAKMSEARKGRAPANKGKKGKKGKKGQVPWNKGRAGTYKLPCKPKQPKTRQGLIGHLFEYLKRLFSGKA